MANPIWNLTSREAKGTVICPAQHLFQKRVYVIKQKSGYVIK
jgi:hypothetical protein